MPSSEVFHKFKEGKLKSGKSGKTVTDPKQTQAIFLSEKQNEAEHGGHYVSGSERHNPLKGTRRPRS